MAGGIPTSFQFGANKTVAQVVANYNKNASSAGTWWATRYLQSKTDPFVAASNAANYWLQRLNEVGISGFQAGLGRVNKQDVATLVSTSGPALYAAGITNKGVKRFTSSMTALLPVVQQAAANLPPRGTDAQNDLRQQQMVTFLRSIRGQYRSR